MNSSLWSKVNICSQFTFYSFIKKENSLLVHFWGQVAARTLGDLVRKLGEKILPEIIPILEDGLRSDKSDERQGVCIGLSEIMKSTSRDAVSYTCQVKFPFSQVLMFWCRYCT